MNNNEFSTLPVVALPTPDYTGFSMWDQVPPQPKPKPKPNPNPCPPGHRHFGICPPPTRGGGPPGLPGLPLPTPNPTAPFGGAILGANAFGVALLQVPRIRRRRRPGG